MKKVTMLVLMLCLILSGALCYAKDAARTEKEKGKDGTSIVIIQSSSHGGSEKSTSILASIDGHNLMVVFTENLGQIDVEIATVSGVSVEFTSTPTPNGVQCYIPNAGEYIVTFTLRNGDEYYGEFEVLN